MGNKRLTRIRTRLPDGLLRTLVSHSPVTACALFLALLFATAFFGQDLRIRLLCGAFALSLIALLAFVLSKRRYAALFCLICVLSSGFGALSELYSDLCVENPATRLIDTERVRDLSGTVGRIVGQNASRTRFYLDADRIDGERARVRMFAVVNDPDVTPRQGEYLRAKAVICPLEAGEDYEIDFSGSARACGAFVEARIESGVSAVPDDPPFYQKARRRAGELLEEFADGALLKATLLGDRSALSASLAADFRTLGVSHLLALSGLHLSILCGALFAVLDLLCVPRRINRLICLAFCVFYLLFSGMPLSLLRAAGMLVCYHLSGALFHRSSSVRNLLISISVICLAGRFAILDTGLQLSFFATLGILIFVPRALESLRARSWYRRALAHRFARLPMRLFSFAAAGITTTVCALCFTYPILVSAYGRLALFSVLYQLLLVPLFSLMLLFGALYLLSAALPFRALTDALWFLTNGASRLLVRCVRAFVRHDPGSVSLRGAPGIVSAIVLVAALCAFLVFKVRLYRFVAVPLCAAVAFCLTLAAVRLFGSADTGLFLIGAKDEERLLVCVQDQTVVFEPPGQTSRRGDDRLYRVCAYENVRAIDALILSAADDATVGRLESIDGQTPVRAFYLPESLGESRIDAFLRAFPGRVFLYRFGEELSLGAIRTICFSYGDASAAYRIRTPGGVCLYSGCAPFDAPPAGEYELYLETGVWKPDAALPVRSDKIVAYGAADEQYDLSRVSVCRIDLKEKPPSGNA